MSHIVKVRSRLTDKSILCAAMDRLKWQHQEKKTRVYGEEVDILLEDKLGLAQQSDGTWMVVGDPYYTQNYRQYYGRVDSLINTLTSQYMAIDTTQKLNSLGFYCTENEQAEVNTQDQKIQMVFERSY